MKKVLFVILILAISINVFAQSGYKEYKWGMTPDQVKQIVNGFVKENESPWGVSLSLMMIYFYGTELTTTFLNPMSFASKFEGYTNGSSGNWLDNDIEFLFDIERLVGVETYFNNAHILNELVKKYGEGISVGISISNGRVWKEKDRYIVWSVLVDGLPSNGLEFVTYLDADWINKMCSKSIDDYRKTQDQVKSRLD